MSSMRISISPCRIASPEVNDDNDGSAEPIATVRHLEGAARSAFEEETRLTSTNNIDIRHAVCASKLVVVRASVERERDPTARGRRSGVTNAV